MIAFGIFAALCSPPRVASFDDFWTFFVQKLVAAIGAEELDLFAPKFLIVTIKFAFALRTGHPKNFRHDSSNWRKSEIRSTKSETNRSQINLKLRKSKTPTPILPFRTLFLFCLSAF
jgi:hypothetical protein